MSDKTLSIGFYGSDKLSNKDDAKAYLSKQYEGIVYNENTNSFEYRGLTFDYFLAGVKFDGSPGSYLLIEKETGEWLYSYGEKEERWKCLLARMDQYKIHSKKSEKSIFEHLRKCLGL